LVSAFLATGLIFGGLRLVAGQPPQQSAPAAPRAAAAPPTQAAATPAPRAAAATPAQAAATPAPRAVEKPIRDLIDAFAKAYSTPDLKALDALIADEANVVDTAGESTRGRSDIMGMYASSFNENPGLTLEPKVQEIQFITPDVARIEGQTRLSTKKGDASEYTRFSSLAVKRGAKWLIAEIREYPAPVEEVTSYDRLKELEWMVGDWVDESESVKASSSVRWADNNSFLIRTYHVDVKGEKETSGTVIIGWDPPTGQIKSWLFDSNGGHGEGLWTRTGEKEWVVKAHGVLTDGRPTSATQIHTIINNHSVKTSSTDRIIGGQIAPDIVDVVMVRKAPHPERATDGPATAPAEQEKGAAAK
jgi:uncharacterized protein (TIGR02246 family)